MRAGVCGGGCNGRSECQGWDHYLWRSIEKMKNGAGSEFWIRLEDRSGRKKTRKLFVLQTSKADLHLPSKVLRTQSLIIGRG